MDPLDPCHLSDDALLLDAKSTAGLASHATARLLTRIAEIEKRRLFMREGYASLKVYCVRELGLCDEAAEKRITAAHISDRFPAVLIALADNRLHLTAVLMLGRHLTAANSDELVAAATRKTRFEIAMELARRFPRPELPERLEPIVTTPPMTMAAPPATEPPAPERVREAIRDWLEGRTESPVLPAPEPAPERVLAVTQDPCGPAPERVEAPRPRMTPLAEDSFGLQVTINRRTYELLQKARSLLSHQIPRGEMALVLERALELAVEELEKRKYAATDRPGRSQSGGKPSRHIPAPVRREVRKRDGDRCAFVSESGKRCESRTRLECHHEDPFARGGPATVENTRLLCAAHNQHKAERDFGTEFMERKRAEAKRNRKGPRRNRPHDGKAHAGSEQPDRPHTGVNGTMAGTVPSYFQQRF